MTLLIAKGYKDSVNFCITLGSPNRDNEISGIYSKALGED